VFFTENERELRGWKISQNETNEGNVFQREKIEKFEKFSDFP
jgi:hypothetical protein